MASRQEEKERRRAERLARENAEANRQDPPLTPRTVVFLEGAAPNVFLDDAHEQIAQDFEDHDGRVKLWNVVDQTGRAHWIPTGKVIDIAELR